MADGNITVEVSTQAAQAELERLRAENAALKHDLQYARDGLIRGRTRMREDNERLRAALARQLAQRGEPVAGHVFNVTVSGRLHEWEPTTLAFALRDGKHALYTAPPQRQPLSEAEMFELAVMTVGHDDVKAAMDMGRAVEIKHGIGGDE